MTDAVVLWELDQVSREGQRGLFTLPLLPATHQTALTYCGTVNGGCCSGWGTRDIPTACRLPL